MLVSLMAVYTWDNSIFDNLILPVGMDTELLEKELLRKTAELSLVYSDPTIVKAFIGQWCLTRQEVWKRLWELANENYDPLVNYDRDETEQTFYGHREDNTFQNNSSGNSNTQKNVYGFDSQESVGDNTLNTNNSSNANGTDATQHSGTDRIVKNSKGNIGVTTYQQMMKEEFEIRPKLDIYQYIIEDFKHEFCVLVY